MQPRRVLRLFRGRLPLLRALCLSSLLLAAGAAQDAPILRTPDASILDRIALDRVDAPPDGLQAPSPYGVRSVWGVFPDFTQDGPWSTVFVAGTPGSPRELLRVTLDRHANVNPLATWINDELLHVRVWWSRIAGSDLIVDVPSGDLLYHKMFFFPSDLPPREPAGSD